MDLLFPAADPIALLNQAYVTLETTHRSLTFTVLQRQLLTSNHIE